MRVFVHVTTPDGRTILTQDHWPLAGHLPTPQWRADAIRERYVVCQVLESSERSRNIRPAITDKDRILDAFHSRRHRI
jgi:hypothetical protein